MDPVTFEVIRHKLMAITDEQAITLKSVSGSPIVTECNDFNNGIYLTDGSIVTMGYQVMMHAGTMAQVIKNVVKDCQDNPGINEDDMFIVNDPYRGALHLPDVSIVAPIFYQGRHRAWVGSCAHQVDIGGMDPGSWCPKATEQCQEGIIIPPVKLVERGNLRKDIWNMILSVSRLPSLLGLDLRAMMAANNVAKRRLLEIMEKYGVETVEEVMGGLIELSERKLRERLKEFPDGIYRSEQFLDHDGHDNRLYKVSLAMTKKEDSLTLDFSGSSKQAPSFINCTESGLIGGILTGLLPILAFDIPWNEGLMKPINIIAPKGIICNSERPAPSGMASVAAVFLVTNTTTISLSLMASLSEKYRREAHGVSMGAFSTLNLSGMNQYDEPFGTMLLDPMAIGGGAYPFKDGLDVGGVMHGIPEPNIANVEHNENFAPIFYLYRRMIPDTAGFGRFRGGRAGGLAFTVHKRIEGVLISHGVEVPNAVGLHGGLPASCSVHNLFRNTDITKRMEQGEIPAHMDELKGEKVQLGAKPGRITFYPGDVFEYTWQGGGGYGDPLERNPSWVGKDVMDGSISPSSAEHIYGVVIDPSSSQLDLKATEELRMKMRRERLGESFLPSSVIENQGQKVLDIGDRLELVSIQGERVIRCQCKFVFGPAEENWKIHALKRLVTPTEVGPLIRLHKDLEIREYICPGCGVLHQLEIARKNDPPLWDVQLFDDSLIR